MQLRLCPSIHIQGGTPLDPITTNMKQANRKLLLKQLAMDLCTSEQRILFRTQYVRKLACSPLFFSYDHSIMLHPAFNFT